jgi:hypothetical protein
VDYLVVLTLAYRDGSRMCYADHREVVTVEAGDKTSDILQTAHDKIVADNKIGNPEGCSVTFWSITPNVLMRPPTNRQTGRK